MHDQIISGLYTTLINFESHGLQKKDKTKKERHLSYYHYSSPAPLGRLRAIDEGILDKRDSNAHRV
jgi:hypothetical protein